MRDDDAGVADGGGRGGEIQFVRLVAAERDEQQRLILRQAEAIADIFARVGGVSGDEGEVDDRGKRFEAARERQAPRRFGQRVPRGQAIDQAGRLRQFIFVRGVDPVPREVAETNRADTGARLVSATSRGTGSTPRTKMNCRSEERRVGKECRSRWSPYH